MSVKSGERYPRGTAYHEAGHAVVAWSLGLRVCRIEIRAEDEGGHTQTDDPAHLSLLDQLAVHHGGIAAENTFGHRMTHKQALWGDQCKIIELLKAHGISPESGDGRASALRDQGYERARGLVEEHRTKVVAVAEQLVKHGSIEKDEVRRLLPPLKEDR